MHLRRKPVADRTSRPPSVMDVNQAKAILGLENSEPSEADVIEAHRRLMQRVHPDKGGSAELAAQLNEAKRVLLQTLAGF